jgi:hypothetical protein
LRRACIKRDLASSISGNPEMRVSQTLMVGRVTILGKSQTQVNPEDKLISEMTEESIPKSDSASLNVSSALSQNTQLSPV